MSKIVPAGRQYLFTFRSAYRLIETLLDPFEQSSAFPSLCSQVFQAKIPSSWLLDLQRFILTRHSKRVINTASNPSGARRLSTPRTHPRREVNPSKGTGNNSSSFRSFASTSRALCSKKQSAMQEDWNRRLPRRGGDRGARRLTSPNPIPLILFA